LKLIIFLSNFLGDEALIGACNRQMTHNRDPSMTNYLYDKSQESSSLRSWLSNERNYSLWRKTEKGRFRTWYT